MRPPSVHSLEVDAEVVLDRDPKTRDKRCLRRPKLCCGAEYGAECAELRAVSTGE